MSKPAKPAAEPSFEDALTRLEAILEAMETGELALETLLARFEEGTKLVKLCQDRLATAEVRLQKLEQAADGTLTVKPLEVEE